MITYMPLFWMVLGLFGIYLGLKVSCKEGVLGFMGVLLTMALFFVEVIFFIYSFEARIKVGDSYEVSSVVMRTNDVSCVVFKVGDEPKALVSSEAWVYNNEVKVMVHDTRNLWNYPMEAYYNIVRK